MRRLWKSLRKWLNEQRLAMLKRLVGWLLGKKTVGDQSPESGNTLRLARPHPENSAGPFYVVEGHCTACQAPIPEAPTLIAWAEHDPYHCVFRNQPETPEELEQALNAMGVCCVAALRYGGDDPVILRALKARGMEDLCTKRYPSEARS
jgi:hypothetical protein